MYTRPFRHKFKRFFWQRPPYEVPSRYHIHTLMAKASGARGGPSVFAVGHFDITAEGAADQTGEPRNN